MKMVKYGMLWKAMTPAEIVSFTTWDLLARVHCQDAPFGEETITDLLVLYMLRFQRSHAFQIHSPTKHRESDYGADLLVWIRRRNGLSRFLAIQAKIINSDGRYEAFDKPKESANQLEKLEKFAQKYHAVPLYLLYNHFNYGDWISFWNCDRSPELEQLGCTMVPSWNIAHAIRQPKKLRSFREIHANAVSLPWRCVFDCCQAEQQLEELVLNPQQYAPDYDATQSSTLNWFPNLLRIKWPKFIHEYSGHLPTEAFDELLNEIRKSTDNTKMDEASARDWPLHPRMLLIVDYYRDS